MKIWKQIAGSGGCFRAGTQVQLEGGKTKSIELLKEGDEILAFGELGELHLRVSLSKDGKRLTRVAEMVGVPYKVVAGIKYGNTWRHV